MQRNDENMEPNSTFNNSQLLSTLEAFNKATIPQPRDISLILPPHTNDH